MNLEEILLKDLCPKWLRLNATSRLRIGSIVMAGSLLWLLAAPCLSAYNKIPVITELDSHWLAAFAFLYGAANFVQYVRFHLLGRLAVACILAIVFFALWTESNSLFCYWKVRAVTPEEWLKMTVYLQNLDTGNQKIEQQTNSPPWIMPVVLRPLGLPGEYSREEVHAFEDTEAIAIFGYPSRTWGIHLGSKQSLESRNFYGCECVQIGKGVYFFVGHNY